MFQPKPSVKNNCGEDYAEYNESLRLFRVVVKSKYYFSKPTISNGIQLERNAALNTTEIRFTLSANESEAKAQVKSFKSLLISLNKESQDNGFYLKTIDFFARQCDHFADIMGQKQTAHAKANNTVNDFKPSDCAC